MDEKTICLFKEILRNKQMLFSCVGMKLLSNLNWEVLCMQLLIFQNITKNSTIHILNLSNIYFPINFSPPT